MKLITFFEGVFFSCFYSVSPYLLFDLLQPLLYNKIYYEPQHLKENRYYVISSIAFVFFYLYSRSGLRGQYTIWHLQRHRYASGFTPIETLLVALYHSVFLCLSSELFLPWIHTYTPLLNLSWGRILDARMKNLFFLSILQHSVYELSGFGDKVRREYFLIDRI
jgi:hypothetical protein